MTLLSTKELLQEQLNTSKRKPKGVKQPVAVGQAYNVELQRIVREITKDIRNNLMPLVRSLAPEYVRDSVLTIDTWVDTLSGALRLLVDRWTSPQFRSIAEQIANRFVRNASDVNAERTRHSLGIDVFANNQELTDQLTLAIRDNTRLITSIPEQYLTQVESIVLTNVRAGGRPSAIAKLLQKQFDVTENRAKMIARDQTAKVNGDLNAKRQQAAGFPYFQWMDSDDERVRDRHNDIAEKVTAYGKGIYRWDDPPLSDRGTPIIPGQDFQCRCFGRPVGQDEVDENVKAGRTQPGVKR